LIQVQSDRLMGTTNHMELVRYHSTLTCQLTLEEWHDRCKQLGMESDNLATHAIAKVYYYAGAILTGLLPVKRVPVQYHGIIAKYFTTPKTMRLLERLCKDHNAR
jgi:hypothetical protein